MVFIIPFLDSTYALDCIVDFKKLSSVNTIRQNIEIFVFF